QARGLPRLGLARILTVAGAGAYPRVRRLPSPAAGPGRHRKRHVHGVQFHPESILTPDGPALARNFLEER
ncbi:MAG: hypothetical protein WD380_06025, partial [Gaiellaceae bacterium]